MGGAWALGNSTPTWEHAPRLLAVVLILPPLLHLVRSRLLHRQDHLPLRRLVGATVLLIIVAFALDVLLARWTTAADLITAVFLTVAFGGPALHRAATPTDENTGTEDPRTESPAQP